MAHVPLGKLGKVKGARGKGDLGQTEVGRANNKTNHTTNDKTNTKKAIGGLGSTGLAWRRARELGTPEGGSRSREVAPPLPTPFASFLI